MNQIAPCQVHPVQDVERLGVLCAVERGQPARVDDDAAYRAGQIAATGQLLRCCQGVWIVPMK